VGARSRVGERRSHHELVVAGAVGMEVGGAISRVRLSERWRASMVCFDFVWDSALAGIGGTLSPAAAEAERLSFELVVERLGK
jgi:hypothetical protein